MNRRDLIRLSAFAPFLLASPASARPIVRPAPAAAAEIERRIDQLLARMTLTEKIGQLNLAGRHDVDRDLIRQGRVGAIMNSVEPDEVNEFQRIARASRLGIPLLLALDAIHGFRTMFPLSLGQASTWNPALIEEAARITAQEGRAVGLHWTFGPMIDMSRDPRWGRVHEGGGEDVHFASVVAAARTRGYQAGGLAATPKHFAGYGAAEQGRDYNSTWIPTAQLHDLHLPPFRAALAEGALTVMAAFNALNGLPATAHRGLLTELLKERWGFDGVVVSDFNSIGELVHHGVARDDAEAGRLAINAGIDVDMVGYIFQNHLEREVRDGRVAIARIDDATKRVLRLKFRLGLFEEGEVDGARALTQLETPAARASARRVAREAAILLTNRDDVLPIAPATRRIAVVGYLASHQDDNPWPGPPGSQPPRPETVVQAMRRLAPAGTTVEFEAGLADANGLAFADRDRALSIARAADMIVAVLGEAGDFIGEAASRTTLGLPGVQDAFLEELAATGKPVVLVLATGRPLVLTRHAEITAAILQTFHGGTEGRTAIAEILFGAVSPSGRVPMSYPRSVGQIPVYYDYLPTGRPPAPGERWRSIFLDERNEPLFPFGHGLTYTRFAYSGLALDRARIAADGTLAVSVDVRNTGARAGQEVVQVYVRQIRARRSRPVRQLKAFEKIALAPGETKRVTLTIRAADLGYHDDEGRYHVDPGPFRLFVGTGGETTLEGAFEVV